MTKTMTTPYFDVIIIGGGIAGFATGLAFTKLGYKVKIIEKALELYPVGAAIGLFPNGLNALKGISQTAFDKVQQNSILVKKMVFMNLKSQITHEVNTHKENVSSTPSYLVWYKLQQFLIEELPKDSISLATMFISNEDDEENDLVNVTCRNREDNSEYTISCKILIATDGIKSTLRAKTFGEYKKKFHGKMMFRASFDSSLIETQCPRGTAINYAGDQEGKLFTYRETSPGVGTITAMINVNDEDAIVLEDMNERKKRWRDLFSNYPSDVTKLIDAIPAVVTHEDKIQTVEVLSEWSKRSVIILGDACHAMTPGLGQGVNITLEDAIELANCVHTNIKDLKTASIDEISDILTMFWKGRISRVKEVHMVSEFASSAARKTNYGKSISASNSKENLNNISNSKDNTVFRLPIAAIEDRKKFYDMVYSWQPTTY